MEKTKKELQEHVKRLETIIDGFPFDVWYKDLNGKYLIVNKSVSDMSGVPKEQIIGRNDYDVYPEPLADIYTKHDVEIIEGKRQGSYYEAAFGNEIYEEYKNPVLDDTGKVIGTIGFSRNVTKLNKINDAMKQSEEKFRTIFEEAPLGMGIFDSMSGYAYQVNSRFAEILGRTKEEVLFLNWMQYSHPNEIEECLHKLNMLNENRISGFSMNKRYYRPDGSIVWVNMTVAPFMRDDISNFCYLCMIEDITARKAAEEEILYLSYYDQLTGLYNRRFYEENLKRLDTERNLPLTLVLGDVNGLKLTNDAFGHMTGDQLLKRIGEVLKRVCRSDDIIARIGGDEFVLLLPKTNYFEAEKLIKRIKKSISNEKIEHLLFSVSFGWETKNEPYENLCNIYMQAEDEMYRQKLKESADMHNKTINAILNTLYQKNEKLKQHCERVGELCEAIGLAMGFNPETANELKTAGYLHDIGKIGIDESLLNKKEKISKLELADIKRHSEIGYYILRSVSQYAPLAEYVLHHHERVDGKGYPSKLRGEEIPLQARIIRIADAYDTMVKLRVGVDGETEDNVIREIVDKSGTHFDRNVATVFIKDVLGKVYTGITFKPQDSA